MGLNRILRRLLIFPVAFGLAAQTSFASKPAKARDCCTSSCPTSKPSKKVPDCCKISAAPDHAAVTVAAPAAPVSCAILPSTVTLPAPIGTHAVAFSEVWSPPARGYLAPSGLSPPRLA